VSSQAQETRQERDARFERRLVAIGLTSRQKDLLRAIRNTHEGDAWFDIGNRLEPPQSSGAARNMMSRLKKKYRERKRFTNLYEEIVSLAKKRRFQLT